MTLKTRCCGHQGSTKLLGARQKECLCHLPAILIYTLITIRSGEGATRGLGRSPIDTCPGEDERRGLWIGRAGVAPRVALCVWASCCRTAFAAPCPIQPPFALCVWGSFLPHRPCGSWVQPASSHPFSTGQRPFSGRLLFWVCLVREKVVVARFGFIWQLLSNYGVISFKRFVSSFTTKLCN